MNEHAQPVVYCSPATLVKKIAKEQGLNSVSIKVEMKAEKEISKLVAELWELRTSAEKSKLVLR